MSHFGETLARKVAGRIAHSPVDQTALAAITVDNRYDGQIAVVMADQTLWQFVLASTAAAAAGQVIVPADAPSAGRWLAVNASGGSISPPVANAAALRAVPAAARGQGQLVMLTSDGSLWRFSSASTLADDGGFLVIKPTAGTGAWLRVDKEVDLLLPVSSATANSAVLYTVPAGFILGLAVPFWHVTTTFTTASAGAAGLSSSNAGLNTAGDLLGGATGDLVATLVSTGAYAKGTVGAKIGKPGAVIQGGETILFNLIAGTYTAGAGVANVPARVLLAPAA